MISILTNTLVLAGVSILIGALIPVRRLIAELPRGRVRRQWYFLSALFFFVIGGYLVYAADHWGTGRDQSDLIVPMVFFLVACFALAVNTISLQTAHDVRRIAVLEHENITDPLMGIYNRRYLERRLREEVARAQRYDLPLSILLLDIDHFKKVNDTHGHPVGDQVLSALGQVIMEAVRVSDVAARYGGEEVLIVALDTTLSSAAQLAERMRQSIEDSILVPADQAPNGEALSITASIGVVALCPEVADSTAFFEKADEALYQAKHDGRNRVAISPVNASS